MKRNGLVFVPREPPKRVILYPTQDSTSQQTNGFSTRSKTALVTNNRNETIQQSTTNVHLSRQKLLSSPSNSASKLNEKPDHDGTIPNPSGQSTSLNVVQNPYYANPFFRPKIVTNQQPTTVNANVPPPSRDSSTVTTNITNQSITSGSTTVITRGRQPIAFKTPNSIVSSNGRTQEADTTVNSTSTQEDNRRWAHTVASAPIARRTISDERTNGTLKSFETINTNPINNDILKAKGASATDIVISLMDTWRAPINPGSTSAINIFTRNSGIRDDSVIINQPLAASEHLPSTPPFLTVGTSPATSNNNQNWKKALVANFQKNSRNNPTAKLFTSKQTSAPIIQPSTTANNDSTINQQPKPERTIILNGLNNERAFQLNENTPIIPSLVRKSTESLRVIKQDNNNNNNNNNNNIERSTSLQIQSSTYSNPITTTISINKTEEITKTIEVSNSDNVPHVPISIPSALIIPKPPANVEQQRAIITRVMIRRDFVKSTESKPPMPTAANFRSTIPPQSAKPGGLPTNNVIQVSTITENNNVISSNSNPNRIYPFQQYQYQQQQQQSIPLSQKSLLSFTATNAPMKESLKIENNSQQSNGITNDNLTSSSIMKIQQSQTNTNNNPTFRSTSLSAANAESRKKKEELLNKAKKRATSASAVSNDGLYNN